MAQARVRAGRAWAMALLAAAALAGLVVAGVWYAGGRGGAGKGPGAMGLAAAARGSFDITITAGGELESRQRVELRNRLERESTITFIVPEGTRVKAGEVVVELNADNIRQQIDQLVADLESAKAALVGAENGYQIQVIDNASKLRQSELKVELAELALQKWVEGEVSIKRQENDLKIDRAMLELGRLAEKYAKSQELLWQGFLSKDECDRDEVSYIEAISNWKTSQLAREVYEEFEYPQGLRSKQSEVDQAKDELERTRLTAERDLASKAADRANRQQQATILEGRLQKQREQADAATIKAPQDGLVVYASSLESSRWGRNSGETLQVGQQVWSNQLLAVLPDTSEMVAAVRVQEALAGRIRPGQSATVKVDAVGGRVFEATVDSIGVLAESGGWRDPNLREYTVRLTLQKSEGHELLKPAMRVESRVMLASVADAVYVPIQAVFQEGPVRFVYVPSGSAFERVPVRVGRRSDTLAELAAGIEEGQRVLVREPAPGEIRSGEFDRPRLELAGYKVGEDGKVEPEQGSPGGRPRGGEGRGRGDRTPGGGGERPGAPGQPAGEAAPRTAPAGEGTTQGTPSQKPAGGAGPIKTQK